MTQYKLNSNHLGGTLELFWLLRLLWVLAKILICYVHNYTLQIRMILIYSKWDQIPLKLLYQVKGTCDSVICKQTSEAVADETTWKQWLLVSSTQSSCQTIYTLWSLSHVILSSRSASHLVILHKTAKILCVWLVKVGRYINQLMISWCTFSH